MGENPFMAYVVEHSDLDDNIDFLSENKLRNEAFYGLIM